MAVYNETFSGGIKIKGTVLIEMYQLIPTAFSTGDILYNIHKAKKGVFEKIVIKHPKVTFYKRRAGYSVMYIDTYNALWNESDLVSYNDALVIIGNYLLDLQEELDALNKCN